MSIKFKVFKSSSRDSERSEDQFYAHVVARNGEIIWQSEGYNRVGDAHKLCKRTWEAPLLNIKYMAAPVPYTKDSLLPKPPRVTS